MSLLSQVTKGRIKQPILALFYGVDGSGISTLGSEAPKAIFLGTEKGTANLDVARLPSPQSFKDVLQAIEELRTEKHEFETLVIDSLDWLEPLVWDQVCADDNKKNIEDFGYGKGYVFANKYWQTMMVGLSKLRDEKGMNVILIAHSQIKLHKDPQTQTEYDRYQLKLNEKAAALWREFSDAVLFMNQETVTKTDKNGRTKAYGEGDRYLYTDRRAGYDAKNRYGLPFQIQMPKGGSWKSFMEAYENANPESPEVLIDGIKGMLTLVSDVTLKANVEAKLKEAGEDVALLSKIKSRLTALTQAA